MRGVNDVWRGGVEERCNKRNRSHTQQQDKNNATNKQPHEPPPPTLNNAQKWRDHGAYHHSRPGAYGRGTGEV